jgi:hypothetical protein
MENPFHLPHAGDKMTRGQELAMAMTASFAGSFMNHEEAELLIHSYLEHDGQTLDRYVHKTGSGSEKFKQIAEQVKAEKILVLGPRGSVEHTEKRIQREKERMSIKHPKGQPWQFYTSQSIHGRVMPQVQRHDGVVHWVRVELPEHEPPLLHPHQNDIETPIGVVKAADHLAFSLEAMRKYKFNVNYPAGPKGAVAQSTLPDFERIELVTPARYDGFRFAPVALYMGYNKKDDITPSFYILESGSGIGFPQVAYPCVDMDNPYLMKAGYKGTMFASADNFYLIKATFKDNHPDTICIKIFTPQEIEKGEEHFHFSIYLQYEASSLEDVATIDNFMPPATHVLMAFLRIQDLMHLGIPKTKDEGIVHKIADGVKEKLHLGGKHS